MTTFDDREKGFESKFAHDEELRFKVTVRRNKLLGLWAAGKLGYSEEKAKQYAIEVVESDFVEAGDDDVVSKVFSDLQKAGIDIAEHDIRVEMEHLLTTARDQIMTE